MDLTARGARLLGFMDHSITAVVFTVPEKRLREMDVARGPCVPIATRTRPLVGVTGQDGGEELRHTAALYTALTGRSSNGAVSVVARAGKATLSVCSPQFVEAMADANERMQAAARRDDERGDKDLAEFTAAMDELDREWLRVARWPRSVVSTQNRLVRLAWARTARDRGDRLYCWHGPAVPQYVVVSGSGNYPG